MYKCLLALELDEDVDVWMYKTLELPFVPFSNLVISLHEEGRIFDNFVISWVEWQHFSQLFYCQCKLPHGIGKHSLEVAIEEFKARGWTEEE